MPVGETSGNCVEMAALADYMALETYNTRRSLCYYCQITRPGDHVFALISETPIVVGFGGKGTSFSSVRDFTQYSGAKKWLVIDPWLNTVCTANEYLQQGSNKLDKWTAQGKRVAWNSPTHGMAFVPPGGSNSEYKAAFEIAPIALYPF